MVFYNYIEIGTSDFDTEIQKDNNNHGISIEPIKYYYDKLPIKENSTKLNIAISSVSWSIKYKKSIYNMHFQIRK